VGDKFIQSVDLKRRRDLQGLCIDDTIIKMLGCELDSFGLGYGPVAGSYEHGNESSSSIKGKLLPHQLRDYCLLNNNSPPWSWLKLTA
jgi:hypothetical protein